MKPRYLYFFLCTVAAAPGRFLPLFYDKHGMSTSSIGLLLGFQTLLAIFATPFFSHKADLAPNRQSVILFLQIASTSCFLLQIPFLPTLHFLSADRQFIYLFFVGLFFGVFAAPIDAILRGIAISYLRKLHGEHGFALFGRERMYGAMGWAISSFIIGVVFDLPSIALPAVYIVHVVFSICFVTVSGISIFTTVNVTLHDEIDDGNEGDDIGSNLGESNGGEPFSFLAAMKPVVFEGGMVTFLFFNLIFLYGFGIAVVENLLFLYLVNDLHASNTLCGISVVLSVIIEVIMYAIAPYMLKKLSIPNLLLLSSIAYIIRVFGYAFIPSRIAVLALELLHGVTFATADSCFVAFIAQRGLIGTEATVQSIYMTVRAVGMGFGSVIGGMILQYFGAKALYLSSGIVVFTGSLAFSISFLREASLSVNKSKHNKPASASDKLLIQSDQARLLDTNGESI